MFLLFFSFEIFSQNLQDTYDMVDMVWKLGSYIKVEGGWLGPFKEF